ncbi:MAG: histidine kinase [Gammaproteobacteria bacterium]|nr:histidine kinase [Gammaproteobacteria bacterium]
MEPTGRRATGELFLPELCGLRPAFLVILFAQLLAIMLALAPAGEPRSRFETFGFISLYTQLIALLIAATLCLARGWLARLPEPIAVGTSYLLTLLATAVVAELAWWTLGARPGPIRSGHGAFLLRTLGISVIVNALALRYFYVQHHWRRQIEAESRARLQALQSRIRPHFFFNCMNTIASLTRTSPVLAERAVEDLAELFRASLADGTRLVSVAEELRLARHYLEIEALRLGDRLAVEWHIDELPQDARLPALTLQPLLENAIHYGIEPLTEGGTITVTGIRRQERLSIVIANPLGLARPKRAGSRMAQDNVRERLAAHFGPDGTLTISQTETSYTVQLNFPCLSSDAHPDR